MLVFHEIVHGYVFLWIGHAKRFLLATGAMELNMYIAVLQPLLVIVFFFVHRCIYVGASVH